MTILSWGLGAIVLAGFIGMELLGIIDRPVASVTCSGLESLRIGMAKAEVMARIGEPLEEHPTDPGSDWNRPRAEWPDEITWEYTDRSLSGGHVPLGLDFSKDRLVHVHIYLKTFWFHQGGYTIASLKADGWHSGRQYEQLVCADGERVGAPHVFRGLVAAAVLAPITWGIRRRRGRSAGPRQTSTKSE